MTVLYRFTDAGLENEDLVYSDSLDQSLKALVVVVVNLLIFISVFNQIDAQNLFHNKFYFMPLHVSSTCAHHQEVKIALYSLWYHHTNRLPSRA